MHNSITLLTNTTPKGPFRIMALQVLEQVKLQVTFHIECVSFGPFHGSNSTETGQVTLHVPH